MKSVVSHPPCKKACALHGVTFPAFGCLAARALQDSRFPLSLVVLPEEKMLHRIREDLEFFLDLPNLDTRSSILASGIKHAASSAKHPVPSIRVLPLPELPVGTDHGSAASDRQLDQISTLSRLATLQSPLSPPRFIVVTTLPALVQPLPGKTTILETEIPLQTGTTCSFSGLIERLNALGYDHESEVAGPGHFAVRGGIIDLYPVNERMPFRLDFFGDEIEEIRAFEPDTQRSAFQVKSLTVAPPPGHSLPPSPEAFSSTSPGKVLWQFWEPRLSEENCPEFSTPIIIVILILICCPQIAKL